MALMSSEGWLFLLRWIHFLAGITWIGLLYYFNFVQVPFFAETEPGVRSGAQQKLLPRVMWWFRWGAMITFLSGWIYLLHYWLGIRGLNDPGTRGNDGRITLTELISGVLNPTTLASLPAITGFADLTLPVRASVTGPMT